MACRLTPREKRALTSIQLSYRLIQEAVYTWLAGVNTRHMKHVNLPLIAAFMAGLVWTRGRASCSAIARGGAFTHDAFNRLLKGQSLRALLQMAALTLVDRIGGYLVIDDVVWEKRGKLIEGVCKLFMPSEKRYVFGLNVVVLAWTNGKGLVVPLSFRFWKKPAWRDKATKKQSYFAFDGTLFRTKNELAIELLDWAYQKGFEPIAVAFDAAYLSETMLRYLKHRDWHWVSRIKGNRTLKVSGREFRPDDWEEEARAGRAPDIGRGLVAHLPGWGQVRLMATWVKEDGSLRYLVGSNPNWGRGRVEKLYGHRWGIEPGVFRDGKQLAGLGDCHCRSFRAQENHFALALLALVFLAYQTRRAESTEQALRRLGDRPIALATAPVPAKVRPIKLEKRRKRQDPHPIKRSGRAA